MGNNPLRTLFEIQTSKLFNTVLPGIRCGRFTLAPKMALTTPINEHYDLEVPAQRLSRHRINIHLQHKASI